MTRWRRPGNWSSSRGRLRQLQTTGTTPAGGPADGRAVTGEGMTLTLPYVPARLVIEIAAPAAAPAHAEPGGGHLALVRDSASGQARTEAAGQ